MSEQINSGTPASGTPGGNAPGTQTINPAPPPPEFNFTRERAAVAEREGNTREARALNAEIASLGTSPNANDRDKVAFLTSLTQTVQNQPVLGRITVTADPALLHVHPEFDLILEPGDALVIPPRPATVNALTVRATRSTYRSRCA